MILKKALALAILTLSAGASQLGHWSTQMILPAQQLRAQFKR